MISEKISQFYGARFKFKEKEFAVTDCKEKDQKALIYTDKRTFAFYEHELDDFLLEIVFLEAKKETLPAEKAYQAEPVLPSIRAEIVSSNERASRISQKLEDMFDKLSVNPTEEVIKQAKAMQDLSNSIVNVETLKFKFLTAK
ncbi:hypothetical protein ASG38_15095 [Flavobacterium sp. Leaf359]|uniref:hypothetical protein n=1 Tax=Flavobacterium sp. Leaf359 TaxID=1736351 RepID=UPI0007016C5A|nr:hypothetical protein [Flavobacterium sp. Leaf359]KQS45933.1 hypothetical protein ASG38_15095 [Flavobacterium sp. Leaf359]